VPRKNPVPQREKEICQRLREIRLALKFSQVVFAEFLAINSPKLASYELGRVPIRFDVAITAAEIGKVSLWWLAEGIEPKFWPALLPPELIGQIQNNPVFSVCYDTILKPFCDDERLKIASMTGGRLDESAIDHFKKFFGGGVMNHEVDELSGAAFSSILDPYIKSMPEHLRFRLWDALCDRLRIFLTSYESEIAVWQREMAPKNNEGPKTRSQIAKSELTIKADSLTNDLVKPVLPKLIERLKRATEARGSKSELAAWLGVHRQSVTDWLSGKQEPGGETTLRMLQWVEQRER
jgi:DNA-binding transcriptional regulator YiaG